jgi:uncharacterized caspase-like protein
MRVLGHGLALVAAVSAGGCAARIFQPASPTLTGLEQGDVHVSKVRGTQDSDIYKITYVTNVPAEVAWHTAMEMPQWLPDNRMVGEFAALSGDGGRETAGSGEGVQRYLVRWRDSTVQELVLRRDDTRKLIDITIVPHSRTDTQWGHCTVMIGPYRRNSALVEAEVRISTTFGSRLANLLLTPANLITGPQVENRLQVLWEDLALAHRGASERALEVNSPSSGRTHIIAVGVESFEAGGWDELEYSEDDAAAFFDWAARANPVPPGDRDALIRALLVGPEATSERLGEVLQWISDPGPEAAVRPGDTVLFFYAGHIELEEDVLAARGRRGGAKYGYLVTSNADPDNLRFTAIKRDDVLDALRYSEAARCVLFCDACYSGGQRVRSVDRLPGGVRTRGREAPDPGFQQVGLGPSAAEGEARAKTGVLAAARPFSLAAESDELEHGLFTHAVLEGLGGGADGDGDGYVTLAELSEYIEMKVPQLSDAQQRPYVSIPASGGLGSLRWPVQPPG